MTDTHQARGPHLPDVLTRQSPWVWLFVAAALFHVWLIVMDPSSWMLRVDDVLISLLGAALFVRHPDARRSMPLIAFGLGLLALAQLLPRIDEPIVRILESMESSEAGAGGPSPAVIAVSTFETLTWIAGSLYLGLGLSDARRRPRTAIDRGLAVWVGSVAIVIVVIGLYPIASVGLPDAPGQWVLLGLGLVLALLSTLAWSYVLTVTLGGFIAGESPARAWGLAAAGAATVLLLRLISAITSSIVVPESPPTAVIAVMSGLVTFSWLSILIAFAIGLPAATEPALTGDRPEATQPGSAAG